MIRALLSPNALPVLRGISLMEIHAFYLAIFLASPARGIALTLAKVVMEDIHLEGQFVGGKLTAMMIVLASIARGSTISQTAPPVNPAISKIA